ncbi:MAG: beta-galactosidase [Oscillospiraceae bacterium]|nr:beta-galactosidase [Oscillospiraceae bacterium]
MEAHAERGGSPAPWIFGAAYYEEYLPYDRLERDMEMMAETGFNTIRIAESTWSVEEPRPGEYDFSHVDRAIDAAARHGLRVIVGTPTYAVPAWLAQMDPEVLALTKHGRNHYGPRQNMDITNPTYLRYAEGIIRALVRHTAARENVIGFQIDNETKHYGVSGPGVLERFRRWMERRWGSVERMNLALGLNYWSNSVTSFDELPDPEWANNGSYYCEFQRFRREIAAEFLLWQSGIVREYKRPDQFITQNFDFEWVFGPEPEKRNGYSGGVQPDISHYDAQEAVTLLGTDIYCPAQDRLTGREIHFCGDLIRSLRRGRESYLVCESQSQAFKEWLPYPGQLRQMAFSHFADGAGGLMYWSWSSIHNGRETYWKGLLSHDFLPNPTLREVGDTVRELQALAPRLAGLRKRNSIALVVSNEALSALAFYPTDRDFPYHAAVHRFYDALCDRNLECDVIFDRETDWSGYRMLVFPSLYCASEELIGRVRDFVAGGGTVFAGVRSFFTDGSVKVWPDAQPHGLTEVFGMRYSRYTAPVDVAVEGAAAEYWMELLEPEGAEVKARYAHKYWGDYAAVTKNRYGAGSAWYLGTVLPADAAGDWLLLAASEAGLTPPVEDRWPVCERSGETPDGKRVHFVMNYSREDRPFITPWSGRELRSGLSCAAGETLILPDWGVVVLEEG